MGGMRLCVCRCVDVSVGIDVGVWVCAVCRIIWTVDWFFLNASIKKKKAFV